MLQVGDVDGLSYLAAIHTTAKYHSPAPSTDQNIRLAQA